MENLNNPNHKVTDRSLYDICPFQNDHSILKSRMTTHISRCKNNHPLFKQCPFNSNHWSKNMEEHVAMCPQKTQVAKSIITVDPNFVNKETCNVQCDDEWADEGGTYDPQIKLATANVIRVDKKLMPRAERKAFMEEERLRLNKIKNQK